MHILNELSVRLGCNIYQESFATHYGPRNWWNITLVLTKWGLLLLIHYWYFILTYMYNVYHGKHVTKFTEFGKKTKFAESAIFDAENFEIWKL